MEKRRLTGTNKTKGALLILAALVLSANSLFASITKGPYMIYANNASGMTVLWQTSVKETCSLAWGTSTSYTGGTVSSTEYNTSHQHKKTITGLASGTKYYYKVTVGSSSYTGSFRAAPASSATAVKFLVYGDTRSNPDLHNTVASRMVSTINGDSGYQTFALHVGDLVEDGQTESDWTNEFFPRSKSSILSLQSKLPIQGTMGNHEGNGTLYKKYFPYPFVADRYWSFDYGPVHVSVVDQCVISASDSSFVLSSTQFNWLTNDLAKTSKKWKVVLVHHPGYSAGGHVNNTYLINTLRPQFEKYGVTTVFGGHNHYYARAVRNGIHYVTSGGGGASKTSTPDTSDSYIVAGKAGLQFCKIEINGDNFICKSVAAETGSIIDTFTVTKTGGTPITASCHIDTPTVNVTKNLGDTLLVQVSASDPDGVERVKLYLNGVEGPSDSAAPYDINLVLTNAGTFTLTAAVKDLLGNYTASDNSRTITVNSGTTTTTVPNVINLTQAAATTSITGAGLVVGTVSTANSSTVAAGNVISQTPGGGTTVNLGSSVALSVSLGPVTSGTTVTFTSVAAHDGYVDESSETSNVGGAMSSTLTTGTALRVGDTGARKQRKTFVSFNTASLPDTAVVTKAVLKLKRGGILGTPTSLGAITVDIKNTSIGFGTTEALEIIDFQAAASKSNVGTLSYPTANDTWATATLNADGISRINKTDHTQFRIRFTTDDDNDSADDYLGFYSGDNATAANRPVLEVTYQ